ncbi:MAG: hypothetical protein J2P17_23600 [Mycobacterium sp.]|nr:hypothetical protein [Mycobacterium sp.]
MSRPTPQGNIVRWALTVKQRQNTVDGMMWDTSVIDEVTGTREQALAQLWQHAVNFQPKHPRTDTIRRRVLRDGDGFLVINESRRRVVSCEFRAYEILWDSQ